MRRLRSVAVLVLVILPACSKSPTAPTAQQPNCVITPSSMAVTASPSGGATTLTITVNPASCAWTVATTDVFITLTSGAGPTAGTGIASFTVAPNTGTVARAGRLTFNPGNVIVTINQAPSAPPLVFAPVALANPVVGVPYAHNFATAAGAGAGGVPPIRYQLDTLGGFPPIGLILAPNGVLSGTASVAGPAVGFRVCAVDAAGTNVCVLVTITVVAAPAPAGDAALVGNWAGSITLNVGCLPASQLPRTYNWTGSIRARAAGGFELVVTVPGAFVFNEVFPLTLNGNTMTFTIDFDSRYTFTGTMSADRRAITGTFIGGNCNVPPTVVLPSGTWTATKT